MAKTDIIRQLYEEEAEHLFFYIKNMIGNNEFAEDILQETFCVAVRKSGELKKHPNPKGWLYTTAKYIMMSECRKRNRIDVERSYANIEEFVEDPYTEIAMRAIEEDYVEEILTESEYAILDLVYVQGYKNREAAVKLGMNESAFRVKLFRIRNKLNQIIKQ